MNLIQLLTGKPANSDWHDDFHDFPGGVHPPENKSQSLQSAIQPVPLQNQYIVPLNQHIGAFAEPIVEVGDHVLTGQIIAEAAGFISAPSHAPCSGTVISIGGHPVPHASGLEATCIVIESDGEDSWRPRHPWQSLADHHHTDLLARIQQSGVTGLGGASFPTAVKLSADRDHVDTLIVNGTECEPYITADHALMRERADRIYSGIRVVHELYDFQRILIGIEDNKPDAIEAMRKAIPADLSELIDLRVFPTKYPSGGEKQLIYLLTGREVPAGGLPLDLGMLCHNVGTLAALADAVFEDMPLIQRVTTVTGKAVTRPGNYEVRIGTRMDNLLAFAGYQNPQKPLSEATTDVPERADGTLTDRVIMGGPMMGFTLDRLDLPVVKATNCLLAPTEAELPLPPPAQPCIRCGMCEQVCPVSLLPQQLMWFAQAKEWEKAESHQLFDCIECGACAYVCPSHIPLVQYYRYAKGTIRQEQAEHKQSERARKRFEARQARLEREQAEKEARRKERAAAARARQQKQAAEQKPDSPAGASDAADDPVAAAVARAKAKRAGAAGTAKAGSTKSDPPKAPVLTPEQMQAKLDNQRKRLEKAEARLAEAAPETQKALETTVSKLREQIASTERDLARVPAADQPDADAQRRAETDGNLN